MSDLFTNEVREMVVDERGHSVMYGGRTSAKMFLTQLVGEDKPFISAIDICSSCGNCGEYVGVEYVDEETVRAKTKCSLVEGITTVVEINVPSGKIVINDSLRDVYDPEDDDLPSYNSKLGQHRYVERMAELGCAYGPVLNTSPGLYEIKSGKYVIANPAWNEDDEFLPLSCGGTKVAWVCTDLWAYSIADYDDYVSKGGQIEREYGSPSVVEVPAGRYRLTHHTGEAGFSYDGPDEVIFGEFERIGDVDE